MNSFWILLNDILNWRKQKKRNEILAEDNRRLAGMVRRFEREKQNGKHSQKESKSRHTN